MAEGDSSKNLVVYIMLFVVLVIVVVGLAYIFYYYIYPNLENWGWGKPPAKIEAEPDTELLRLGISGYKDLPGGLVVFKICKTVSVCDIELKFDGVWKVRPYLEYDETKKELSLSEIPFLEVSNEDLIKTNGSISEKGDILFFKKWNSFNGIYNEFIKGIAQSGKSDDFENGLGYILEYIIKKSPSIHLQIEKRRFEDINNEATTNNLAWLRLNAIITKEDLDKKKIVQFTKDYLDFAQVFDSNKESGYESRRLNLVFLTKPETEDTVKINNKVGNAKMDGLILYSDESFPSSEKISQMMKNYQKKLSKGYYFVKGDVANNFFSHMENTVGFLIGNAGTNIAQEIQFSHIKVKGKAESEPANLAKFSKIVIDGEVFTKDSSNTLNIGSGMSNSQMIIGSLKGELFIGDSMQSSIIKIKSFEGNHHPIVNDILSEVWINGERVFPKEGDRRWEQIGFRSSEIHILMSNGYWDDRVGFKFFDGSWHVKNVETSEGKFMGVDQFEVDEKKTKNIKLDDLQESNKAVVRGLVRYKEDFPGGVRYLVNYYLNNGYDKRDHISYFTGKPVNEIGIKNNKDAVGLGFPKNADYREIEGIFVRAILDNEKG